MQCAAKGREGSASPLLHFATAYLFHRGKRLLDRSFLPQSLEFSVAHLMLVPPWGCMTMKRISFPDSDYSRFMFHKQRGIVVLIGLALVGFLACERTPDQTQEAKKPVVADKPGMVHLTAEELARTVIEVTPVARGALLVPRQYTATVHANENELAEVTTLIGGRVVTVLADVGQDVKKGALLASRIVRVGSSTSSASATPLTRGEEDLKALARANGTSRENRLRSNRRVVRVKLSANGWEGEKAARSGRSNRPPSEENNKQAWREHYSARLRRVHLRTHEPAPIYNVAAHTKVERNYSTG